MSLKGGSSNFGIVTRFTIRTFPLGKIWGGDAYYSVASLDAHIKALYEFTANPNYDVDAGYFLNYAYTASSRLRKASGEPAGVPRHHVGTGTDAEHDQGS